MYGNRFPVEAEVPILMIIGLALGHLIFAAGVGYFIRKKKKKDCYMPMLGYIVCTRTPARGGPAKHAGIPNS